MVKCSNCGRNIPEVAHCISCDAPLCSNCGFNGLCSNCMEIYVEEEDLGAKERSGEIQLSIYPIDAT